VPVAVLVLNDRKLDATVFHGFRLSWVVRKALLPSFASSVPRFTWRRSPMKPHPRIKPIVSLDERLAEEAKRLRQEAKSLPPGPLRKKLMRRARQSETIKRGSFGTWHGTQPHDRGMLQTLDAVIRPTVPDLDQSPLPKSPRLRSFSCNPAVASAGFTLRALQFVRLMLRIN
jgi:hypothetical protein